MSKFQQDIDKMAKAIEAIPCEQKAQHLGTAAGAVTGGAVGAIVGAAALNPPAAACLAGAGVAGGGLAGAVAGKVLGDTVCPAIRRVLRPPQP